MEIKIDLEKAYSRFSWVHIKETLLDIGLSHNLVELILWCTSSSKIRVLWNGEALGEFKPTRGIHQDYPMSSYLFLLCIERQIQLINIVVDQKMQKLIQLSREGPTFSYLAFADNLLFLQRRKRAKWEFSKPFLICFVRAQCKKLTWIKHMFYFLKMFCSK